jgi:integrase
MWRGNLSYLLPKRPKLEKKHHSAMPYRQLPDFLAAMRQEVTVAALAFEFCILTASRRDETRAAAWDEINLSEKLWTIPAKRMKAGRTHVVPLSSRCIEILEQIAEFKMGDSVFPGAGAGGFIGKTAFNRILTGMKIENATVHGMRSSFRDWCGDESSFDRETVELALAHTIQGVEGDYRRSTALDKRRLLMEAWSLYCLGESADNVVMLRAARAN